MILYTTLTTKADAQGVFFKIDEDSFSLDGNVIWNGIADSLVSCSLLCTRREDCKSANFMENGGICSLLRTHTVNPENLLKRRGSFCLRKVGC